jgi:hypothetical protein
MCCGRKKGRVVKLQRCGGAALFFHFQFSDVGDYLSVYHNNVDFVPGPCYQMVQQELYAGKGPKSLPATSSSWPLLKVDNLSTRTRVIKTRTIVTPSPITGSVPFMTPRQLGILGSLAVLRKI